MATKKTSVNQTNTTEKMSSYSKITERLNNIVSTYSGLPMSSIYSAFDRAVSSSWNNLPSVQNSRVKSISPLPANITKEELGEFLRNPQNSELSLQQVSEGLKWTAYPFYKIIKSYQDIPTYKNYIIPKYLDENTLESESFKREFRLVEKIRENFNIPEIGHKVVGQALTQGKVFYIMRSDIDKSHNKVNTIFFQELPKAWSTIIGYNNISKYTISFNMMYFMQQGTDYRQFGDLFVPYINDFYNWWENKKAKRKEKYVYASYNNEKIEGQRDVWEQNGTWFYYVSLPIDRVWTFEIDDTTPIVASPLSGLLQTFSQQADYEAAQLSLILNPLIKIFTGEIPYYQSNNAKDDDGFRLSLGMMKYFVNLFYELMRANQTAGAGLYAAPLENIKSHDFQEAAGANDINQKFSIYSGSKSGTNGIIPLTERPTEESVKASQKLESKYPQCIYRTLEKMLDNLLDNLNLNYSWKTHVFGDIYSDELTRSNALKQLDKGDIASWFVLCALDNISLLDKLVMSKLVKLSGLLELQIPPQTAYTQSSKSQQKSDTGGAPSKDKTQVEETKIEKQVEVTEE